MAGNQRTQVSTSGGNKESMKLLVAVDFGTTFSGVAYVQTKQHQKQEIIQWWGEGVEGGEKAPTILKYPDGSVPGLGPYQWGFQVDMDDDEGGTRYEWFKLGLYPNLGESDLVKRYPPKTPQVSEVECEKMVVDYLTSIRENFDRHLQRLYRAPIWSSTPKEYIITVPAVWPEKSKDMTRACAEKAGMGRKNKIQIFAEPEAAGIYALDSMKNIDLNVNDTFVLCDAGGGTVDLISYTVKSLTPAPHIKEAAPGSGSLCGSSFLNRIFAEYLDAKFKDLPAFDQGLKDYAMKEFEGRIKRQFTGAENKSFFIAVRRLPNNPRLGINRERLEITGRDLRKIFDPVIKEIVKLVKAQIQATKTKVKAVLLAGGFGRNGYVCSSLQDEVGIETAVLHIENREIEEFTGEYRIEGATVKESQAIPLQYFARKAVDEGPFEPMLIDVFVYEDPANNGPPLYKTEGVEELVKLKANLDCIPTEKLKRERGDDDREYYGGDFDIEMVLNSASLSFKLVHAGKTYDEEAIEAEFV
ncbi:hypothetical protein G7Y89_g5877 [Cudoniella acicularis]|uniref:Actin-like ATPase domain-containing protein n=1 Tax=Cudoniella acicularis TaxID=354080 RepID=A0A8H4RNT5_9HELO|nr:hypothetical protein G7Y89_g5877 [Cudoniella acicularis]